MSNVLPNKVDMSLDDIIKISKSEKKMQAKAAKRQAGRGGGLARGRGTARGQGRGAGRGRGNTMRQALNRVKQLRTNLRGGKRGRGRGRGGSINLQNSGVSPLRRNNLNQQYRQGQGRGRGRGRGGQQRGGLQRKQMIFTNSNQQLHSGQGQQQQSYNQQQTQRQRLNKARQQAALLREKQLALKNLQQAKKNMQSINVAIQKTSRDNVVAQMRGLSYTQPGQGSGRGRGRGRLLTPLMRQTGSNAANNTSPTRQLTHTSVTITNPTALNAPNPGAQRGRRRRWRRGNNKPASEHFTIQVANQNSQPVMKPQSSVLDQLKLLKPAVTTQYKFQKSVFATPATGVSLNDRFSASTSSLLGDGGDNLLEGRKVFL